MGVGAALAFYEENATWLNSPQDAYHVLYPQRDRIVFPCPLCGKKFRQARSVIQHLESSFHRQYPDKAAKADAALEAFRAGLIE